jgi:hypothetical protein
MLCKSIRPIDWRHKIEYWFWTGTTNLGKEATMEGGPPDIYCDTVSMVHSPFSVAFTFSLSPSTPSPLPGPGQPVAEPQAIVRMSLEHAKMLAMMVRKTLKQYELEHLGDPIKVPAEVLRQLNLSEESDW